MALPSINMFRLIRQVVNPSNSKRQTPNDQGHRLTSGTEDSSLCIEASTIIRSNYPITSGALGDVYKCTRICDTGSDEVAVKVPRFGGLSKTEVIQINKSIDREIHIWAMLKHQYVLPFYGTAKGFGSFRALVSPWMPNGNLESYLNRADMTLTMMDRLCMLKQITEGLKYLHDKNVIHGNLNRYKILIAADGSPRLAGFGISNIVVQSNPTFSYHTGAVRWVAPEFIITQEDQTIQFGTKPSDIYALGGIMLEVLYGKQPYWWLKNAVHVVSAKFKRVEPINTSLQIQPTHLYFMRGCWSPDSKVRPSVDDVLKFLQELLLNESYPHGQSWSDEVNEEERKRKDPSQCSFQKTEDTRTLSQSPSFLDIDSTNPHGRSGSDEVNEERDDPYENYFRRGDRKDTAGEKDTAGGKGDAGGNDSRSVSEAPAKISQGLWRQEVPPPSRLQEKEHSASLVPNALLANGGGDATLPTPPAEGRSYKGSNSSFAYAIHDVPATSPESKLAEERSRVGDNDNDSVGDIEFVHVRFPQVESDSHSLDPPGVMLQDLTTLITKVGDYAVARGGFGEVWRGIYQTDQGPTDVAVKALIVYASDHGKGMEKKINRIQRELRICASLQHKNILPVFGYTNGFGPLVAIVCPWAENGNLTTYLKREDVTLPVIRRFQILIDITAGLQYLHSRNVIHGDLTGPNVLIHGDGTACLADFGLSLVYSEVLSTSAALWTSAFHGNYIWLAPERIGDSEDELPVRPSKHSDIYSFGGIMLQVLTGKMPYYYLNEVGVIRCIGNGTKPLRGRYPVVSDKCWSFLLICWSDVIESRPTVEEVVEWIGNEFDSLGTVGISRLPERRTTK